MSVMRAKFKVSSVESFRDGDRLLQETISFTAVAKNGSYPEDGSDEDNTYARYTPNAECRMIIANPALFGKLQVGSVFYVDFTPAE